MLPARYDDDYYYYYYYFNSFRCFYDVSDNNISAFPTSAVLTVVCDCDILSALFHRNEYANIPFRIFASLFNLMHNCFPGECSGHLDH